MKMNDWNSPSFLYDTMEEQIYALPLHGARDRIKKESSVLNDPSLTVLADGIDCSDPQVIAELYDRLKSPLFSLVLRYTCDYTSAEDVLQDVFLTMMSRLHTLENKRAIKAWAYGIAIRKSLQYVRRRKIGLKRSFPFNNVEKFIKKGDDPYASGIRKSDLEESIQILPFRLKSVFLLHDVQGVKHKEIAQILGCSIGTSKSHLFKARERIRKYLKKKRIV